MRMADRVAGLFAMRGMTMSFFSTTNRTWLALRMPVLGAVSSMALLAATPASADAFDETIRPVFREHCVKCHGRDGKTKGKVDLLRLQDAGALAVDPRLLTELIAVIDQNEMPPEDEEQLTPEARTALLKSLRQALHSAIATDDARSATPIRRMNRFQYNNAVQDLFELTPVVFTLPERMLREHGVYFKPETGVMPDQLKAGSRPLGKSQLIERRLGNVGPFPQDLRAEHGFDNRASLLSLSPLLLESFLKLGRSIVESPDFNAGNCGIWDDFFAPPDDAAQVDKVIRDRLKTFLTRAFRRPVDEPTLNRYWKHAVGRTVAGESFEQAMKGVAAAALASPRFFCVYDRSQEQADVAPEDDFDLASRLSFFLWGSIPDQRLLDLAAAGRLRKPGVLKREVDRMLNDRKLKRFCDSFPSQWLQLERIITSVPNPRKHPNFYFAKYRASMHMMLEPLLVFETVLIENRPILELIDSDFSYRSELLKAWYRDGSAARQRPPTVIPFQRVPVTDRREGGVITTAAVMTMTSNADRTQPITRGAWIASVVFNDPPDPPPANVPPLEEDDGAADQNLTLRERFAAHRERPDCAGCHNAIDPFGFAFENYGPTGRWRDRYENGREVDASGELFRRHKFSDAVEFKDAILAEKDRFVRAFAKHLLSFALGREIHPADTPALDRIVAASAQEEHRLRALIKQIVLCEPFRQDSKDAKSASR